MCLVKCIRCRLHREGQHCFAALTLNKEDAVFAGRPDPWESVQVQIRHSRVAIAALHVAPSFVSLAALQCASCWTMSNLQLSCQLTSLSASTGASIQALPTTGVQGCLHGQIPHQDDKQEILSGHVIRKI